MESFSFSNEKCAWNQKCSRSTPVLNTTALLDDKVGSVFEQDCIFPKIHTLKSYTSECGHIWRQDLYRSDSVKMRSPGWTSNVMGVCIIRGNLDRCTEGRWHEEAWRRRPSTSQGERPKPIRGPSFMVLRRNKIYKHFDLVLWAHRTEKINCYCLSHPTSGTLL